MQLEDFFNQRNIVELSFFNFTNAITAAYFADADLRILKVNDNFRNSFPSWAMSPMPISPTCWNSSACRRPRSPPSSMN